MAMCKVSSAVHFSTHLSGGGYQNSAKAHWSPNTDVYATESGLVVKVELAGMRSENLEIMVEGQRLRISGTRPDGCRSPKCNFLLMEINYGSFERMLELPTTYDLSQAKASYLNGFLRIDVPLAHHARKATKVPVGKENAELL
jgi:HSP20 family protein